jgi:hypothetical protein
MRIAHPLTSCFSIRWPKASVATPHSLPRPRRDRHVNLVHQPDGILQRDDDFGLVGLVLGVERPRWLTVVALALRALLQDAALAAGRHVRLRAVQV